jgi:integrase
MASQDLSATARRDKKTLTVKKIEAAKPKERRYEVADASLPSFYLSVMPSGHKSFALRYRYQGTPRRLGLGTYPKISLQTARQAAREALGKIACGGDPCAERAAQRRAPAPSSAMTIDALIEKFLFKHVFMNCRYSTWKAYKHMLEQLALPAWRGRPVDTIARKDIRILIEEVAESRPVLANRLKAVVASMFSWSVEREFLTVSPAAGIRKPTIEKARDRALSDSELRLVLDAADKLPRTQRHFIHLLALTLQRRGEVAGMRWGEIDWDAQTWRIPAERSKNGRAHMVPLSSAALSILKDRQKDGINSSYVFSRGSRPFRGFSRLKEALDAEIAKTNGGIPPWRLHDLRRSGASIMPALGITLPVVERILNHVSGSFSGIVQVYQRYDYAKEMAEALEAWAIHLAAVQIDNVVQFSSFAALK